MSLSCVFLFSRNAFLERMQLYFLTLWLCVVLITGAGFCAFAQGDCENGQGHP